MTLQKDYLRMAKTANWFEKFQLATNPQIGFNTQRYLLSLEDEEIAGAIAQHTKYLDFQKQLAQMEVPVREKLSMNDCLFDEIILLLLHDPCALVRSELALHHGSQEVVYSFLVNDPNANVCESLAISGPDSIRKQLSSHPSLFVRAIAAGENSSEAKEFERFLSSLTEAEENFKFLCKTSYYHGILTKE